MASKSRYNLRSGISEMGAISSRTRSRSSGVVLVGEIGGIPARKRGARVTVKTEPSTPGGVVVKVEPPDCSSNVEESVEATPVPPVQVKVEPPSTEDHSSNSPQVVESPVSPVSSASSSRYRSPIRVKVNPFSSRIPSASRSRSSSPIFLKAEPSASSSLSTKSSVSSISSSSSRSSLSSTCSSFHLPSPSPPPRRYNRMSNWDVRGGDSTPMNDAPSASKVKVWDVQNGQYVIRELPLVATEQPTYEQRASVSTYRGRPYFRKPYYKKPYYKKPYYRPYYWQRNNRGGGRGRWQCRCKGGCSSCGAVTEYQASDKFINIPYNIVINTPATQQPTSVRIEELTDEGTASVTSANPIAPPVQVNTPSFLVVPHIPAGTHVFVAQPSSSQIIPQVSYNYMGHNVSFSARFH